MIHLPRSLVKRADPDNFTPHGGDFVWYALGDSYTAGPGAGDLDPSNSGECFRSTGSYGPQLSKDWLYDGTNKFNFLACTGAISDDVLNTQLGEIGSDPAPDFVMMTLGGNDIGFAKIAKACLVGLVGAGNCDDKIAEYVLLFALSVFQSPSLLTRGIQREKHHEQPPRPILGQVEQGVRRCVCSNAERFALSDAPHRLLEVLQYRPY